MQQARNVAEAYNNSIYMMVSVPYLLLGIFGFMIYRGVKKNEAFRKQQLLSSADQKSESPKP